MKPSVRLAAMAAALIVSGTACGSAGGDVGPATACPTPTPAPVTGRSAVQIYFTAIREAERAVRSPTDEFLAIWPSRKFSRQQDFRQALATAADEARCAAERMRALRAPDERFHAYDEAIDIALDGYINDMRKGREAAETRNVSKFREWLTAVDGLPVVLEAAQSNLPGR